MHYRVRTLTKETRDADPELLSGSASRSWVLVAERSRYRQASTIPQATVPLEVLEIVVIERNDGGRLGARRPIAFRGVMSITIRMMAVADRRLG